MSDLLTLVNKPASQHAQMQHARGSIIIPGKAALYVGEGIANLMTVPHHGSVETTPYMVTIGVGDPMQAIYNSVVSNFGYLSERLNRSSDAVRRAVEMDLNIMHGNPVFQGTRIPIYQIIEELADGTTLQDILEGYPSLTVEKIQTGLDFAASVVRIYDE
jgi:uncharacterized protein (DUF433 family)